MLSMTTMLEKPTVPTPKNMTNVQPKYFLSAEKKELPPDTFDRPVALGKLALEDYRDADKEKLNAVVDPTLNDRKAEAAKATLNRDIEDETVREELFRGFQIKNSTQPEVPIDEYHDEITDDLKVDLGDPDDDDVDNK